MTDKEICKQIRPVNQYVLVRKLELSSKSGMILLPADAAIYTNLWKVLRLMGKAIEETPAKPGDVVVLVRGAQKILKFQDIDNDDLFLVEADQIAAIYKTHTSKNEKAD